jgi:hypothetical protein
VSAREGPQAQRNRLRAQNAGRESGLAILKERSPEDREELRTHFVSPELSQQKQQRTKIEGQKIEGHDTYAPETTIERRSARLSGQFPAEGYPPVIQRYSLLWPRYRNSKAGGTPSARLADLKGETWPPTENHHQLWKYICSSTPE